MELTDEQAEKLYRAIATSVKVQYALEQKTNQELGKLLVEHIQGNMSIFSPQYELIEEVLRRLEFDADEYYEEAEADDNLSDTQSN